MRVLIGCVAENNERFLAQALRLVLSVRWFGGQLAGADMLVGVLDGVDEAYAAELRQLGATVRQVARVDPQLPRGNKISLFGQPEIDNYDTVLYLDCDTVVVQDPLPHLSRSAVRAKMADAPTVPQATLDRLCRHFVLPQPTPAYVTTCDYTPTSWYVNAGVMNMPAHLIDEIVPLWRHYMSYLGAHPALFAEQFHCSQAGLALAYETRRVPFDEWPQTMNFPLHLKHHQPAAMLSADPIILHYHSLVEPNGLLMASPYPGAQARIEQFNARLRERLEGGWRFPTVSAASPAPAAAVPAETGARGTTGTVLVQVDDDPTRLQKRLEGIYGEARGGAPRVVLVGAGELAPEAGATLEGMGLSLPYAAVTADGGGPGTIDWRGLIGTERVGFLAAGNEYAAPDWEQAPMAGEALVPWLPALGPAPADRQAPPKPLCGWLATMDFLERLRAGAGLADWDLWRLMVDGLAGSKLDWLAARPAADDAGRRALRPRQASLTGASAVLAIVPHYNCNAYLDQCLRSLRAQTRPPDDIVVVDDGSDVSPAEIVQRYAGVRLWTARRNMGLFRILQAIIDATVYDGYLIQDADDWSAIDRLSVFLAEAERTGADIVGSQEVRLLCEERRATAVAWPLDGNLALRLRPTGLPTLLGTSLISRRLLKQLGGYATGLTLSADRELLQRAIYAGRVVTVPAYAYFRRKRPDSMTMAAATRMDTPERLANQTVAFERSMENKRRVAVGVPPRLDPPRMAAHALLEPEAGGGLRLAAGYTARALPAELRPVCVTGMHRSGTSMVARLLNLCGLDLGAAEDIPAPGADNKAGYWENRWIVAINTAILERLGAGWDLPPTAEPAELAHGAAFAAERQAATEAAGALSRAPWWGWKDPRTSLTMPFWRALVPNLRVVVCVRHPLEVAASLNRRGVSSTAFALKLWEAYYTRLLASTPRDSRIVTHYDSYFADAKAELRRLLMASGIEVPEAALGRAAGTVAAGLRHHTRDEKDLPAGVARLYADLCEEAGPVFEAARRRVRLNAAHASPSMAAPAPADGKSAAQAANPFETAWAHSQRERERLMRRLRQMQADLAKRNEELAAARRDAEGLAAELKTLREAGLNENEQDNGPAREGLARVIADWQAATARLWQRHKR